MLASSTLGCLHERWTHRKTCLCTACWSCVRLLVLVQTVLQGVGGPKDGGQWRLGGFCRGVSGMLSSVQKGHVRGLLRRCVSRVLLVVVQNSPAERPNGCLNRPVDSTPSSDGPKEQTHVQTPGNQRQSGRLEAPSLKTWVMRKPRAAAQSLRGSFQIQQQVGFEPCRGATHGAWFCEH